MQAVTLELFLEQGTIQCQNRYGYLIFATLHDSLQIKGSFLLEDTPNPNDCQGNFVFTNPKSQNSFSPTREASEVTFMTEKQRA